MRFRLICSVLVAVATSLVCTATGAMAASYVYATGYDSQKVDEYTAAASGALSKFGSVDAIASNPYYMVMTANLHDPVTHIHLESLYLTTFSGNLISFSVGANGKLVHKTTAQGGQLPAGSAPLGIALSPDDRNAYVAAQHSGAVYIYDISSNGSIKTHSPAFVVAGTYPVGVAVSRDGKSVYVAEDGDIRQFTRSANGSLTPKTPATVPAGVDADWVALTPDGKHLYVANYDDSTIGIYNVGANGTLTQQPGSPVATGYGVYEMAVSPNGKSLYATDCCDFVGPSMNVTYVHQYTIKPNGFLAPKSPFAVAGGVALDGVWLSPSGQHAYVANIGNYHGSYNSGYAITQFNVGSTGLLSPMNPRSVASDDYPAAIAVTPDESPTAFFTVSGQKASLTRKLDGTKSVDFDGTVTRYRWSFGDGKTVFGPALEQHTYRHAGTYTVRLTVTDNAGCSTAMVWTGQMAYCDGNRTATVTHAVTAG